MSLELIEAAAAAANGPVDFAQILGNTDIDTDFDPEALASEIEQIEGVAEEVEPLGKWG